MFQCFFWKVLSPVFTVHWGLAKKKGRPTWRERFFFVFQFCHFPIFKFLSWLVSSFYFFFQAKLKQQEEVPSLQEGVVCQVQMPFFFWVFESLKFVRIPMHTLSRYNLDYAAEWAREQAAIKAEHDKMMKRFKPAKPTKKPGGWVLSETIVTQKNKLVITAMIQNKFYSAYEKLSDWVCAKIFLWFFSVSLLLSFPQFVTLIITEIL